MSSSLVAKKVSLLAFLPSWSSSKDPDRYIGIMSNSSADDVITVVNGLVFKTLKNNPERFGLLGCQVRSNVTVGWIVYLGDVPALCRGPVISTYITRLVSELL
jgi:hypothetical protein